MYVIGSVAFDVSNIIAPDSVVAAFLRGVFNIHPVTTWLQAAAWLIYVIPVLFLFLRGAPGPAGKPALADRKTIPAA